MVKKEMWTPEETSFLNAACEKLAQSGMVDLYKKLDENLVALEHQANALALYPSILDSNRLGGTERNLETLVSALSDRYREEDVFVLPTKAILGRSYEIGKINILYVKVNFSLLPKNIDILGGEDPLSFVMNRMLSIMTVAILLICSVIPDSKLRNLSLQRHLQRYGKDGFLQIRYHLIRNLERCG